MSVERTDENFLPLHYESVSMRRDRLSSSSFSETHSFKHTASKIALVIQHP